LFSGFGLQSVRSTDRLDGVDDEMILGASATLARERPLAHCC